MNHDICPNGVAAVLELKDLSKSFDGLHAVRNVNLIVLPGDRNAIIGPNGAGKTTLFNVITGIYPATLGNVLLFGQDVTSWPSHRLVDYVHVMSKGQMVYSAKPDELRANEEIKSSYLDI